MPRFFAQFAAMLLAAASMARAQDAESPAPPAGPRPNIIFVRCDDLGSWALGFNGNKEIKTPNLDLIFSKGVSFSNSFVTTPVCSPSRAGVMTGLHGIQCGVSEYIKNGDNETGIRGEYVTLPEIFKEGGYVTGLVGKWHLGNAPQFHPTRHGFDHFMGFRGGSALPIGAKLEIFGVERKLPEDWTTGILTDEALHFIRMNRSAPFFLMLDYRSPHTPYAPAPEPDAARYDAAKLEVPAGVAPEDADRCRKARAEYYSSISEVDRNVGRIFEFLNQLKLGGNTLLVFTSDNGYMVGEHGLWHKGNAVAMSKEFAGEKDPGRRRPNMFEHSIRVPLAMIWPGHFEPGKVVDELVLQTDLFVSLPSIAGIKIPALPESQQKLDSLDFAPLVYGNGDGWRDKFFGDYDMTDGKKARMRMVRTAEWKLVKHYEEEGGEDELYHLTKDPGETKNLFGSSSAKKIQYALETQLGEWRRSVGDPLETQ